jgi:integrase
MPPRSQNARGSELAHRPVGIGPDGRIFRSVNGYPIGPSTYNRGWIDARRTGLSPAQYGSVLLKRPYDLRHAGVTVRLYAGVPERQVAEWAGHSVEVLRRVYSKIVDGFDDTRFEKIDKVWRVAASGGTHGKRAFPVCPVFPLVR